MISAVYSFCGHLRPSSKERRCLQALDFLELPHTQGLTFLKVSCTRALAFLKVRGAVAQRGVIVGSVADENKLPVCLKSADGAAVPNCPRVVPDG